MNCRVLRGPTDVDQNLDYKVKVQGQSNQIDFLKISVNKPQVMWTFLTSIDHRLATMTN